VTASEGLIRQVLALAHTELDRFQIKATPWMVGAPSLLSTSKSPPIIIWVYKGGSTQSLDEIDEGFDSSHVANLDVYVWTKNENRSGDDSLALFLNLQLACRRIFAQRIVWGSNDSVENQDPQGEYRGSLIKATATLTISVSDQPQQVPGYPDVLDDYAERVCVETVDTTAEDA
jgi:hypothetical protein